MKRLYLITILTLTALAVHAQQPRVNIDTYKYADEVQLWRLTGNAAALSLDPEQCDSSANRGVSHLTLSHQSGDFHRVQEGGVQNHLAFFTERYQKIGRYLYGYGSFHFDMGRVKDRAWSDVMRTYNSNPFISGSSVPGKYDNQDFELNASLSTVALGRFTYGASLLYKVGDLSRLRDPRSRINLAEYRLTPAVTFTTGQHTLGVAAHYDRRKEKLPNMTTVQSDPNMSYYVMTGLENATGTIGGYNGYMREYVDHEFGVELNYGLRAGSLHSVNALTFDAGTEYVYGTYKYEPGRYYNRIFGLSTLNRLHAGNRLHSLDVSVKYEQGYADEYKEERILETDKETGYNSVTWNKILEYSKRYQLKKLDLDVHYRMSFVDGQATRGYVGAGYTLQDVSNKHKLYDSHLNYSSSRMQIEGGVVLFGSRLWLEAKAGYCFSGKTDLSLYDATTDYAVSVLKPDMAYYEANYFSGRLQVTYQMPITIKGYTSNWFASLYGDYAKTDNSLNRQQAGLTIGLYY